MAREKMYELAFQYKDTKLWQRLYDDEMFAVRLTDGEIGYCSVMGMMGEHLALGLYVGNRGYQSFRLLLDTEFELLDNVEMGILLTEQDCLQCSFEKKDMLSDEELLEARKYASLHGRALRGKTLFRNLPNTGRGAILGHMSPNWTRTGSAMRSQPRSHWEIFFASTARNSLACIPCGRMYGQFPCSLMKTGVGSSGRRRFPQLKSSILSQSLSMK